MLPGLPSQIEGGDIIKGHDARRRHVLLNALAERAVVACFVVVDGNLLQRIKCRRVAASLPPRRQPGPVSLYPCRVMKSRPFTPAVRSSTWRRIVERGRKTIGCGSILNGLRPSARPSVARLCTGSFCSSRPVAVSTMLSKKLKLSVCLQPLKDLLGYRQWQSSFNWPFVDRDGA